jgi:hypothetical protein
MSVSGWEDTSAGASSDVDVAAGSLTTTASGTSADLASVPSTVTFAVSASPLQDRNGLLSGDEAAVGSQWLGESAQPPHLDETYLCGNRNSRVDNLGPLHSTLLCVCAAEGSPSPSRDEHSKDITRSLILVTPVNQSSSRCWSKTRRHKQASGLVNQLRVQRTSHVKRSNHTGATEKCRTSSIRHDPQSGCARPNPCGAGL